MGPVVGAPHVILGDMGVNLGGSEVGMAQHRLHASEVGATPKKVCGERVPKLVRRQGGVNPRLEGVTLEQLPECLPRQAPTPGGDEEDGLGGPCDSWTHIPQVLRNRIQCELSKWDKAPFSAFTKRRKEPRFHVHVGKLECAEFAHTKTARVEGLDHGVVTHPAIGTRVRGTKELCHLFERQGSRQLSCRLRSFEQACRVVFKYALAHKETEEAPPGREVPSLRTRGQASSVISAECLHQVVDRNLLEVDFVTQGTGKITKVVRVRLHRMGGKGALNPKVIQVPVKPSKELHRGMLPVGRWLLPKGCYLAKPIA